MRVLHPRFQKYLSAVIAARSCVGVEEFCRSRRGVVAHERTVYRWHRRLGTSLVIFPSFHVEALGLLHLFAFVRGDERLWREFPYAVESAWVTTDCRSRLLFVHAVVPARDGGRVSQFMRRTGADVVLGSSGWETVLLPGTDLLVPSVWRGGESSVLREHPFLVPVVFEAWGRRLSLQGVWTGILERLGSDVRSYVGRGYHRNNGKHHVRRAYQVLSREGLFRQYVVRYAPLLSGTLRVLVLVSWTTDALKTFLGDVRSLLVMAAVYPTSNGWLLRLAGSPLLLERLSSAGVERCFFVREDAAPSCRLRYEVLFDPRSGSWLYPREVLARLQRGVS